ncbi:MAG: TonB-dependent receptor [Flavobacterium sp.]
MNTYKILLALFIIQISWSQKKDEDLGTEVVNVVKPYTATLSDAFKIKETPVLEDQENSKKEEIKYNIFSFPVASTFAPAKGKAAALDKEEKPRLYSNYATLGGGNYGRLIAELFVTQTLDNNDYIGVMLRHNSSQGGIKNIYLDDKFSNTKIDATYGSTSKELNWNADIGFQHQLYNWYGLPSFFNEFTEIDRNIELSTINPSHQYKNAYFGGKLELKESVFSNASLLFNRFWDNYNSAENNLIVNPEIKFEINDWNIQSQFIVNYLSGKFARTYEVDTAINYNHIIFGVQPSFTYQKDDLSAQIGVGIFYHNDSENQKNKAYFYPQVTASYKISGDQFIFYGGLQGGLSQNTYQNFVSQNPFLSPTLMITPTHNQLDAFAGIKGKLNNNMSYNVKANYLNEKNKPLFTYNSPFLVIANEEGYANGNSFGVLYDQVNTLSISGEFNANLSPKVALGIQGVFNSYQTDVQESAWNLPNFRFTTSLHAKITEKWSTALEIFLIGDRKDLVVEQSLLTIFPPQFTRNEVTLKSYFDTNFSLYYKYNDRWSGFAKANNFLNQNYQLWYNYPVQTFQIVLGANYKFDF